MRISISGDMLDELNVPARTRVTATVTFVVDSVSSEGGFYVNGELRELIVTNVRGDGGVDPYTESAYEQLRSIRSTGSHG